MSRVTRIVTSFVSSIDFRAFGEKPWLDCIIVLRVFKNIIRTHVRANTLLEAELEALTREWWLANVFTNLYKLVISFL